MKTSRISALFSSTRSALPRHRHRPVVDRVVKTGAGQHEAIQQGHTDTGGLSIQQRVQHLILQMSMQIEGIANSHVGIG